MTDTQSSKGPLRYRLYYWLINASFVLNTVALLAFAFLGPERIQELAKEYVVLTIFGGIYAAFALVDAILIVWSKLRDEYAEILWKKSIDQLAKLITITPIVLFIVPWLMYLALGDVKPVWDAIRPFLLTDLLAQEQSIWDSVVDLWTIFTTAFVYLFQWNRWRDSR